ncbi:MAG TPA: L-glutamate gamma-semialdehyde dehydrogenase, partial [Deinococcales bacterium]|nr:L-glutamate gamma-semialdehyde dehydrogenase [Deinococcales bacterium]
NEPYTDYTRPEHEAEWRAAIERVRGTLGRTHPLLIGDRRVETEAKVESRNPCRPSEVIGFTAEAGPDEVEAAFDTAWKAFDAWKLVPAEQRASVLLHAAGLLRGRKHDFNALLALEVGKNAAEAEAETSEAIDFLEYYARQAIRWAEPIPVTQLPGEEDWAVYEPLGVGVSISPWNFGLAIFLGQCMGPVAAGNAMIVKPSEDAGVVAAWAVDLLREAGLPAGVVNFLPGRGEVTGELLVTHPRCRFVNFTGSKAVGLHINEAAAKVREGQRWIKRVALELGGKDAMLVDETADLDQAADAAVAGAFGYNGQKCSALSRLIVVNEVHDALLQKLIERAKKLNLGEAVENANVTAVINADARDKARDYLTLAPTEGRVVLGGQELNAEGYFIPPTVVDGVKPDSRLAREEIFAPVLSVVPVPDFDAGLRVLNDSEYGLTGGVFSRNEDRIGRATREAEVGNFYVNRKITGAMVGAHPFGGYKLSGTDSKGGGPDYLGLFLQMKAIGRKR